MAVKASFRNHLIYHFHLQELVWSSSSARQLQRGCRAFQRMEAKPSGLRTAYRSFPTSRPCLLQPKPRHRRTTFTNDDGNNRYFEIAHFHQVTNSGTLDRAPQRHQGKHQPYWWKLPQDGQIACFMRRRAFAVAFRMRPTKVSAQIVLQVRPFWIPTTDTGWPLASRYYQSPHRHLEKSDPHATRRSYQKSLCKIQRSQVSLITSLIIQWFLSCLTSMEG